MSCAVARASVARVELFADGELRHLSHGAGMSLTKRICAGRRVLLGIALVAAASQPLLAAPTSLVCDSQSRPGDPAITIDLDEAKGTATLHFPARTLPSRPPGHVPAKSFGPFAAKFTPKEITFSHTYPQGNETAFQDYRIDRLTGDMTDFFAHGAKFERADPKMRLMSRWTCQVGKAKF